jgi:hypothetical protein
MHIFLSKNLMIHQKLDDSSKLIDDYLAKRNLSKCEKPFSEAVHNLHVGSKYDLAL